MTKLLTDPKEIKKHKWFSIEDFNSKNIRILCDEVPHCCGVIELGEIPADSFFHEFLTGSIKCDGWGDSLYERRATDKEILLSFQRFLDERVCGGLVVCYLVNSQHNGDFGKLIKMDNWVYHGNFWNPRSRNTLHHWSKVIYKQAPRTRKSKSIIRKR